MDPHGQARRIGHRAHARDLEPDSRRPDDVAEYREIIEAEGDDHYVVRSLIRRPAGWLVGCSTCGVSSMPCLPTT